MFGEIKIWGENYSQIFDFINFFQNVAINDQPKCERNFFSSKRTFFYQNVRLLGSMERGKMETLKDVHTLKAHRVVEGLGQVDRVHGTSIVIGTSQWRKFVD